jgi:hypothetical protein
MSTAGNVRVYGVGRAFGALGFTVGLGGKRR